MNIRRVFFTAVFTVFFSGIFSSVVFAEEQAVEKPLPNNSRDLLMLFQDKNNTREDYIKICEKLVSLGDTAVSDIHKLYLEKTLGYKGMFLIETLMKINTPSAMQAMKTVLGYSYYVPSDIKNPKAILQKIAPGRKVEKAGNSVEWLSKNLPPEIDTVIESELARKKGEDVDPNARNIISTALNRLVRERKIFNPDFQNVKEMPEEMKDYAERYKFVGEAAFKGGLAPLELYRFNRMIIDRILQGLVKPGAPVRVYIYSRSHSEFALDLLARSENAEGRNIIAFYHPVGPADQMNHIRALEVINSYNALQKLSEYLESTERSISSTALRILLQRMQKDSDAIGTFASNALGRISWEAEDKFPDYIYRNVINLCAAVPGGSENLISTALSSSNRTVKKHAVLMLIKKPSLARNTSIWQELYRALPDWKQMQNPEYKPYLNKEQLVKLVKSLRQASIKEAIPVIVYCLDSAYYDVRIEACDTMTAFTGEKFDRNPVKWKEWFRQQISG